MNNSSPDKLARDGTGLADLAKKICRTGLPGTITAEHVLWAAKKTFSYYGDDDNATGKSNTFLCRCGAVLEKGPNQYLSTQSVCSVAHSMLDADANTLFLILLAGYVNDHNHR